MKYHCHLFKWTILVWRYQWMSLRSSTIDCPLSVAVRQNVFTIQYNFFNVDGNFTFEHTEHASSKKASKAERYVDDRWSWYVVLLGPCPHRTESICVWWAVHLFIEQMGFAFVGTSEKFLDRAAHLLWISSFAFNYQFRSLNDLLGMEFESWRAIWPSLMRPHPDDRSRYRLRHKREQIRQSDGCTGFGSEENSCEWC